MDAVGIVAGAELEVAAEDACDFGVPDIDSLLCWRNLRRKKKMTTMKMVQERVVEASRLFGMKTLTKRTTKKTMMSQMEIVAAPWVCCWWLDNCKQVPGLVSPLGSLVYDGAKGLERHAGFLAWYELRSQIIEERPRCDHAIEGNLCEPQSLISVRAIAVDQGR